MWQKNFGKFNIFQVVEHIPDNFRTNSQKMRLFQKNQFLVNFCQFYELKITF
jgi:hypothetical protein